VAFSADSNWLGLGYTNGAVELVNLANRAQRLTLPTKLGKDLVALSVEPGGRWMAVVDQVNDTSGAARTLWLWDTQEGKVTKAALKTAEIQSPTPLAFSADGRWLALGNQETVQIWDLQSQESTPAHEIPAQAGGAAPPIVLSLVFAAPEAAESALRLAVGYSNGAIDLYAKSVQPTENASLDFPTPETPLPATPVVSSKQSGPELEFLEHLQKTGKDNLIDLAFGSTDGLSLAVASAATIEIWQGDALSPMSTTLTAPSTATIYRIDHFETTTPDFVRVVWSQRDDLWLVLDTEGGVRAFTLQPPTQQDKEAILAQACREIETISNESGKEDAVAMESTEARNRQIISLRMVCRKYWSRAGK
jgi:WD40 repeat protein